MGVDMDKDELFNYAVSKLKNKKASNAQKATIRQLINEGVIDPSLLVELSQAGNQFGEALGAPEKQSPSKDRLAFILAAIAVTGLWVIGLGLWVLAHHLN